MKYDICVLGLGYIGLPTASIFASNGFKVLGVDIMSSVVDTINRGNIHIAEPDLDVLVRAAVQSGNLRAALNPACANTYIIAVPTPFKHGPGESRTPDLSSVEAATRSLAGVVESGVLVILESTSPVGTTEKMSEWLRDELLLRKREVNTHEILFAHCPERILPGQMLKELVTNDRIMGGLTPGAAQKAKLLYQSFCVGEIFLTDSRTAEMAKLTENAFRDVNIAFANELSLICERLGIDVWDLIRLANRHPRVKILKPGPGVGGHCIAVDPWFIVDSAPDLARLIRSAREVNDAKPHHVIAQVKAAAALQSEPIIACLGLAFKANVDDLRESPAVEIVRHLAQAEIGSILVVEPNIPGFPGVLADLSMSIKSVTLDLAISSANIIVLLVDHRSFLEMDRALLADKMVIDTRGSFRKSAK
jgi:UDP-N-acetyl-D-mannosaminuronic acid dehydrogenase